MTGPYFVGIDVGTQGARVVMMDSKGNVVGMFEDTFPLNNQSREEQSPSLWWKVCERLLKMLIADVAENIQLSNVKAVSVTSTSGTMIPLDANMEPLHNAIMYSDPRATEEGKYCRERALKFHNCGYTGFNSSSGLSKILWFVRTFPEKTRRISKWIHASDYITGKLSGCWEITDCTNVLKTGYDLKNGCWPSYLFDELLLERKWLPRVVLSGTPIGTLATDIASALGLSETVQVVAGMTDGCASQIASGAVKLGDWNTTIGTTLVIKGVTKDEVVDPTGSIYNHRHPEGFWMPGGASNIGADWITRDFNEDLQILNEHARKLIPTPYLAYPLQQEGERFPFVAPHARGFQPTGLSRAELYAANMEGVAYIERYAFRLIETISGETVKVVYTAGGGSNSDTWLTIRSNVLNLPIYKMRNVSGAIGAAILAASRTHFPNVIAAVESMVQVEKVIHPDKDLAHVYESRYRDFVSLLCEKGYIQKEHLHD